MDIARPNLTTADIGKLCMIRDELYRRALLAASIYFRKHPASDADSQSDLTIYTQHEFSMSPYNNYIRVIASTETGHYQDSVDIPLGLLTGKNWEFRFNEWIGKAQEASVESHKRSKITYLRSTIAEYPDEARQILADLK